MNICRICLSSGALKDIFETYDVGKNSDVMKYVDVIKFCLDIQVTEQSTTSSKLCTKCVKKLLTFHKFKCLALKNDAYLKSLHEDVVVKFEDISYNEECIKSEEDCLSNDDFSIKEEIIYDVENKSEESIDNVIAAPDCESDDELLSFIKKSKDEEIEATTKKIAKRSRKRKLVTKKITCSAEIKQMCEECGKIVKDLKAHSLLHQPEIVRKRFSCKECPKMFSSYGARTRHYKQKHLGLKPICKLCNKAVSALYHHMKTIHNRHELQHVCLWCDHRFVSASSLASHMLTHTKERKFECEQCKKSFSTRSLLGIHVRGVHNKEKSHLCQLCSKSFFKKYHLQVHLRSHTKETPYECPDCGKRVKSLSGLKSHRELHGGVKKYSCSLCDMTFMKQGYLTTHMISHTKEKRHECKYCGIKFGRSDHRKRHEFTAHQKHLITTD